MTAPLVDRWTVCTVDEALGYPPRVGNPQWAVIDRYDDDPPECVCDFEESAERIAKALNLLESDLTARIDKALALCESRDGYTTWDQDRWLGPTPWSPNDPAVIAWEAAHGHDARMKCYPEFGCLLLIDPRDPSADKPDDVEALTGGTDE